VFEVKQRDDGQWAATRCTKQLLHHGEEATFPTAEVARWVVDRHEYDGMADYWPLDDGYSWDD